MYDKNEESEICRGKLNEFQITISVQTKSSMSLPMIHDDRLIQNFSLPTRIGTRTLTAPFISPVSVEINTYATISIVLWPVFSPHPVRCTRILIAAKDISKRTVQCDEHKICLIVQKNASSNSCSIVSNMTKLHTHLDLKSVGHRYLGYPLGFYFQLLRSFQPIRE